MDTTTVVIGAGHTGLAVSHLLSLRSIDHVVLERGEVANSWRTERWESLRLLTPNWQTRLPGHSYQGDNPDGFMTMPELVDFLSGYAKWVEAPLQLHTTVTSLTRLNGGYRVETDNGIWKAPTVVVASGGFNQPKVPALADSLPPGVESVTPFQYRRPSQLPAGPVLVVGASATGVQIAEEVQRSGRQVTLAVGEHVRLPRLYRGKDIMWWLEQVGILNERYDEIDDLVRGRHLASPQLVGTPERTTLDLNTLTGLGVRLVGRFAGISEGKAQFSGSLRNKCNLADLKLGRLLDTIDQWVTERGRDDEFDPPHRFPPTRVEASPPLLLDLHREGFRAVLWATGFRPDYSWLHLPVFDRKGEIRHEGGIVPDSPGLYRIGLNLLRRRKSSFIHGAEDDARDLTDHLFSYLGSP
ncbi:MAG TPA: NAD(P)/FAD-dependent oxidoreductase [Acidimicrobiia bacterium]|nr:NAD(P)/FAD-dependent oxidoreductase [Acidimicrobiia bacterium]